MIKTDETITRLINFNDMRRANEFMFTHEHSISNLLSKKHFASLNWDVLRVFDWQRDLSVQDADYESSASYACQKSWTISSTLTEQ